MKYRSATDAEVQDFLKGSHDHVALMLTDLSDTTGEVVNLDRVADFTEFIYVPDVGVVPSYWMELLREEREPIWESLSSEVYCFRIYKFLWFVVSDLEEPSDHELEILPAAAVDGAIKAAEKRARPYDDDKADRFFGWKSMVFPNNRRFCEKAEVEGANDIAFIGGDENLEIPYSSDQDLEAWIGINPRGGLFVVISHFDEDWVMRVSNVSEARQILKQIWS